jgi:hypothetical protein
VVGFDELEQARPAGGPFEHEVRDFPVLADAPQRADRKHQDEIKIKKVNEVKVGQAAHDGSPRGNSPACHAA